MRPPVGSRSAIGPDALVVGRRRRRHRRVEAVDARLLLGRARLRPAPDPVELAPHERPPRRLLRRLLRQPLRLLLEERRVAAVVREELPAIELEDARGHAIEEVAIVRDEQQRARATSAPAAPRATPRCRRRGGWSARRAPAATAAPTAPAPAPRAVARRPTACRSSTSSVGSCSAAASERTSWSRSQPPAVSMAACSRACSSSAASSLSPAQRRNLRLQRRQLRERRRVRAQPLAHDLAHRAPSPSSSGSCGTYSSVSPRCRVTRPASGPSAPTTRRKSVDLPAPLSPTMPTRSRSSTANETPASTTREPNALSTF